MAVLSAMTAAFLAAGFLLCGKYGFVLLGCLMRRADSFEKTLMLGEIEGRRRRG